MATATKLSNLQQELLKIYSFNVNDEDLNKIKKMLADYFMDKAINEADKTWDERGYTNETMDQWLNDPNQ